MYAVVQQRAESLKAAAFLEIPLATSPIALLGTVAAGKPLEPIEDGKKIVVPKVLLSGGENFALRVRGDSMPDAG